MISETRDGKGFRRFNPEPRCTRRAPGYRLDAVRAVIGGTQAGHNRCVSELAARIRNPLCDCRRQVDMSVLFVRGFIVVIPVKARHLAPDEQIYGCASRCARIDPVSPQLGSGIPCQPPDGRRRERSCFLQ